MSGQPNTRMTDYDIEFNPRSLTLHLDVSPQELETLKRNIDKMLEAETRERHNDACQVRVGIAHDLVCWLRNAGIYQVKKVVDE